MPENDWSLFAEGLCRVKEVAGILGCSPTQVRRLLRDGRLPSVVVGKTRRVPRLAVKQYLLAGLKKAAK